MSRLGLVGLLVNVSASHRILLRAHLGVSVLTDQRHKIGASRKVRHVCVLIDDTARLPSISQYCTKRRVEEDCTLESAKLIIYPCMLASAVLLPTTIPVLTCRQYASQQWRNLPTRLWEPLRVLQHWAAVSLHFGRISPRYAVGQRTHLSRSTALCPVDNLR